MGNDIARLTVFPAAPVFVEADGNLRLERGFVDMMALYAQHWDGRVIVVLRRSDALAGPALAHFRPEHLGFEIKLLDARAPLITALEPGPGLVLASADAGEHLGLGPVARRMGLSMVYRVEQTLDLRIGMAMSVQDQSLAQRVWRAGRLWREERQRRIALREADGTLINGFPAAREYAGLSREPLLYLDSQMRRGMFASSRDMVGRQRHHEAGGPLRLVHAGPLDRRAGAHLLVDLARNLAGRGVPFTLDIHGNGPLFEPMRGQVAGLGLSELVRLHPASGVEGALVPVFRQGADLFVACRAAPDPDSSYIDAMGCGLAVIGFDNQMLAPLVRDSAGGWTVPRSDISKLAQKVADLAENRVQLMDAAERALSYARRHDATAEFGRRLSHLARVFDQTRPVSIVFDLMRGAR